MSVYVIKRDSDGLYRTVMMRWSPSVRLAARYEGTPWSADNGTAWVKLRVKHSVPHVLDYELSAGIQDTRNALTATAEESLGAAARRVVAERDALRERVAELEDLLAICDAADAMIIPERDRAQAAEAKLATAIRERDAAVSEGDQQRERAFFLDVADEFGLHIRAIAAEKALGQLAEMTRERGECLVKYSKMSQSILDHEAGMSSSIACVAEARAEAAESRLAQIAALVGADK